MWIATLKWRTNADAFAAGAPVIHGDLAEKHKEPALTKAVGHSHNPWRENRDA
jgi:hypothetical protein